MPDLPNPPAQFIDRSRVIRIHSIPEKPWPQTVSPHEHLSVSTNFFIFDFLFY